MLRRNSDVQDLQYEPPEKYPPDFRFCLHGVNFDLQVKRLHNVTNEQTKVVFERECQKHLAKMPQPCFINFWVSDHFRPTAFELFLCLSEAIYSPIFLCDDLKNSFGRTKLFLEAE